jgi:LPXTG-site transpeptidase (sortase) family protein
MTYFRPYKYVRDDSGYSVFKAVNRRFFLYSAGYPVIFTALGLLFAITQIIIPLISIETQDEVKKPVTKSVLGIASGFGDFKFDELDKKQQVLGEASAREDNNSDEEISSGFLSTSSGSSEFAQTALVPSNQQNSSRPNQPNPSANVPEYYYLTIPKLRINHAKVESQPSDLDPDKALGHYVGSSYPGEKGNAFIYGHSVLPAFYNPKNYKSIFSTLSTLEVGDQFTIEYNNKTYKYAVEGKKTLKPDAVDPLASFKPAYLNDSTVTLMTCSPAGTKLKRLLVYASLVE